MAKLETTSEIRKYFELENNENTTYQDMRLNETYAEGEMYNLKCT